MEKKKVLGEYIFFFALAGLTLVMLVWSWLQPWPYYKTGDGLSIATFPTVFAVLLIVCALMEVFKIKRRKETSNTSSTGDKVYFWPTALINVGIIISTYVLWYIDPILSVISLTLLLLLAGKVRDWRMLVGIPLGMGAANYILFVWLMEAYFPVGLFQ